METPGLLVVAQIPDVCVPKSMNGMSVSKCVSNGVQNASVMACVSACMKMDDGPIQTGDGCGEPSASSKVILVTAPVLRDTAYEARSAFRERPSRTRLRAGTSRVSKETVARTVKM